MLSWFPSSHSWFAVAHCRLPLASKTAAPHLLLLDWTGLDWTGLGWGLNEVSKLGGCLFVCVVVLFRLPTRRICRIVVSVTAAGGWLAYCAASLTHASSPPSRINSWDLPQLMILRKIFHLAAILAAYQHRPPRRPSSSTTMSTQDDDKRPQCARFICFFFLSLSLSLPFSLLSFASQSRGSYHFYAFSSSIEGQTSSQHKVQSFSHFCVFLCVCLSL